MQYRNGFIPESALVIFGRGHNDTDGDWYHALSPSAYARHNALVARASARTGRHLEVTDGFGAYRPYYAQELARRLYGNGAATPGTSSHGGFWEGQDTMAVDYGNWSWVYGGDRTAFYADCRAVGASPGLISPDRGYPDEPWHVVFLDPWAPVPASLNVRPLIASEEDDMLALRITLDNGTHLATLAPGIFAGLIGEDDPEWVKNVIRSDDMWTEVPNERQLQTLLHKHGVAIDCYRAAGADLEIRDARTGEWSRGGRWSSAAAIAAAIQNA